MNIVKEIRSIRIFSLFLFIIPSIALIGSILIHNYLISFKYKSSEIYEFKDDSIGTSIVVPCTKENGYCTRIVKKPNTLNQCYKYVLKLNFVDQQNVKISKSLEKYEKRVEAIDKKKLSINLKIEISDQINKSCILNYPIQHKIYQIYPYFFELVNFWVTEKINLGTSTTINPFINGETSISNIVKRYPLNLFFKPLIYLGVLLMICYWSYYNKILKKVNNIKKNYNFFIFGIISAISLFLHTFYLGWTFESELLTKIKKSFVIFFIFFEVMAQAFLIKKIFDFKKKLYQYLNFLIIYAKIFFVIVTCSASCLILAIFIFYKLDTKFDYIVEWNYFLILLLFYFLSFLMWKKTN